MSSLLGTSTAKATLYDIWTSRIWDYDSTGWDIWWQSAFAETQSSYSQFPSDVRNDIRQSAYAWDEAVISSDLNFDEICATCGSGEDLWAGPVSFTAMGWDTIALGNSTWSIDGDNVLYGAAWLDTDANWTHETVDIDSNWGDVQTVAIHEIGHVNGWKHRCVANGETHAECDTTYHSVMTSGVNGTKRTVSSYDQGKMQTKYSGG